MTSPVTVTRIQNRRGTQDQFDALYPPGYTGTGGCDINVWTRILLPGEIAECTDSRRVFFGNLNGEYFEISGTCEVIPPLVLDLPPQETYTLIPELTYTTQPLFILVYTLVDTISSNPYLIGDKFSKNGELKITATAIAPANILQPVPPSTMPIVLPLSSTVTSSDIGTEINSHDLVPGVWEPVDGVDGPLVMPDISFIAAYSLSTEQIEISYKHNFIGHLTFSSRSLLWTSI